ncbi:MAG TPA: type I glutamate--ammonia ligase [Aggregatilineales bacterium]|nr:type I glutamate--ammonia ligase [Aggregatilineales bacterium]
MAIADIGKIELVPGKETAASPAALLKWAKEQGVQEVDVKFTDLRGLWQHFSIPFVNFAEDVFIDGLGFDGSSIRGFQDIHESDLTLIPDPTTAFIDPIPAARTLHIVCDIFDPVKHERYSRDPRAVAQRAEEYLKNSGIADVCYFGPEAEFFIFTSARWGEAMNKSFYEVDSDEGPWNTGLNSTPNLAYRPRAKEGYFPAAPMDKMQDIRAKMVASLMAVGVDVEVHHHEVGGAGQAEIDMHFSPLLKMADQLQTYKYIIKNVAQQNGYTATFMPKPLFKDNGSGMHCHQSLWKDGNNLFFDREGYALLSKTALSYIAGILKHAPALMAFCAPTTNSYRRLVPGYEAPVNLVYSARNRSAAVRIPMYSDNPKAKRIEFRSPDPTCNPYLAFSAIMMAGLDGIKKGLEPGKPSDFDLFEAHGKRLPVVPGSLGESLNALAKDHEFLLEGGVFTEDLIEKYYDYKKVNEADAVAMRPHPYEFDLYFDA